MTKTLYICIGENFVENCNIGHCGQTHTLDKWLELLFAGKVEQAKDYFKGASDKEVVEYLFINKGKRLKKIK